MARHCAESVCGGCRAVWIEIRGDDPVAGISGRVGRVCGASETGAEARFGASVGDAPSFAGGRKAGRIPLMSRTSAIFVTTRK